MANMIDIVTDELQQYVQMARQANEALTNAANLLNSVVIHNDWQCPERNSINENTQRNRSDSLRLQADCENFYNAIIYTTETFLAAEQETNSRINGVDGKIASFLSVIPQGSSGVITGGVFAKDAVMNMMNKGSGNSDINGAVSFSAVRGGFSQNNK